jgi:hemerythrin superfamily protein
MAATTKQAASRPHKREAKTDAVALLTADHKEVKKLFKSFEDLAEGDDEEKQALAQQICSMLTVHATIEEEIFYPAVRESIEEQDLLDEAEVEHSTAKDLIAQIESMEPGDALYDANVKVLGEYVAHHVKEEEDELFPKLKRSKLDLAALGEELSVRKSQLMAEVEAGQNA